MRRLTPALIDRFRRDFESALENPYDDRPIGIAVSGGGDSVALLVLAAAAYPGRVSAATVDHGLRPESGSEADAVAALCARLGLAHAILTPAAPIDGGNIQEKAREARYAVLAGWTDAHGIGWLLTAHSRDDAAETLLMRAARGSGISGLALMPHNRPIPLAIESPARLIRPLLGWSRSELRAIAEGAGAPIADDPTNADPKYDRSRLRALIAASPDLPAERLAQAARNLREAEDALAWLADEAWTTRCRTEDGAVLLEVDGLPRETRRRLAARAIRALLQAAGGWSGDGLDGLVARLESGRAATLAGVSARPGPPWRFTPAPPRARKT